MKVKLILKQTPSRFGYNETRLTHIKVLNDQGEYVEFAKHTPELIERLQQVTIDLPCPNQSHLV